MQITVSNSQNQVPIPIKKFSKTIESLAEEVFANLRRRLPAHLTAEQLKELKSRGTLSVSLVSNQKIFSLNKKWRQKAKATDVLSFSLAVDDTDTFEFQLGLPGFPIELGEVIISAPRAKTQARDYGHSLERELYFLFVHGFLHVLGFDHITKRDEIDMFGRQDEVLAKLGIVR
ncbi:MAG TPA: rRNA maturation RNase YbeY [Oculatellaceae cyanobacterium]